MKSLILILALTVYFLGSLISEPEITIKLIHSQSDLHPSMALFLAVRDDLAIFIPPIDLPKGKK